MITEKTTSHDYQEIRKKLEIQRKKLLQYCHCPACDDLYECPWTHKDCRKKLNLDTAIAWTVSNIIHQILREYPFADLKTCHNILFHLFETVQFHEDQYPFLHQLLKGTWLLINKLCTQRRN